MPENYFENKEIHAKLPLKLFCCNHPICSDCIRTISTTADAICPWCKRKWVVRNVLQKCLASTPLDYYKLLLNRESINDANSIHTNIIHGQLGDGVLREEYQTIVKSNPTLALLSEMEAKDLEYAQQLQQSFDKYTNTTNANTTNHNTINNTIYNSNNSNTSMKTNKSKYIIPKSTLNKVNNSVIPPHSSSSSCVNNNGSLDKYLKRKICNSNDNGSSSSLSLWY